MNELYGVQSPWKFDHSSLQDRNGGDDGADTASNEDAKTQESDDAETSQRRVSGQVHFLPTTVRPIDSMQGSLVIEPKKEEPCIDNPTAGHFDAPVPETDLNNSPIAEFEGSTGAGSVKASISFDPRKHPGFWRKFLESGGGFKMNGDKGVFYDKKFQA